MEQTKTRSKIRLLDNRERPIDLLAKNILLIESDEALAKDSKAADETERDLVASLAYLETTEIADPISLIDSLSYRDLQQLLSDVVTYLELERKKNSNYAVLWECLEKLISHELEKENTQSNSSADTHRSIKQDLQKSMTISRVESMGILNTGKELLSKWQWKGIGF